ECEGPGHPALRSARLRRDRAGASWRDLLLAQRIRQGKLRIIGRRGTRGACKKRGGVPQATPFNPRQIALVGLVEDGTARLAEKAGPLDVVEMLSTQRAIAKETPDPTLGTGPAELHEVRGEGRPPRQRRVQEAQHRVQAGDPGSTQSLGMKQAIGQGQAGIHRIAGWSPIAAGKFQGGRKEPTVSAKKTG